MKKKSRLKKIGVTDNRGFSLLELLISIVILVLIMVPLMGNFIRAMKLNNEADNIQGYSDIAADIAEDIKTKSLKNIKESLDYDYTNNGLKLNPDHITYSKILSNDPQDTYYIGLVKEDEDKVKYDVLVSFGATEYRYTGSDPEDVLMNNFKMPDINALNDNINGMLFTDMYLDQNTNTFGIQDNTAISTDKQLDQIALDYFTNKANEYAEEQFKKTTAYLDYLKAVEDWYNEVLVNKTPTPAPPHEPAFSSDDDYCKAANIQQWMTKTSEIKVITGAALGVKQTTLSYRMIYHCDWSRSSVSSLSIDDNIAYDVKNKTYSSLNQIYLYYKPFYKTRDIHLTSTDTVHITNQSDNPINLYVVKQGALDQELTIKQDGTNRVNVYTNIDTTKIKTGSTLTVNPEIISSSKKDRIYSVEIKIYPYVNGPIETKYQGSPLYTLDSNMDE